MATRTVSVLILAAALAAPAAGAQPGEDGAPSPVERQLQRRYLDTYYLLRADVQVLLRGSETQVSLTYPVKPKREWLHPNTFVTPDGVFYTRDFDETMQMTTDVRVGVLVDGGQGGAGGVQADLMTKGGTVGNVVDLTQAPQLVYRAGDLVRVIGVEETALGVQFHLEGFQEIAVPVVFRSGRPAGEPAPDDLYPGLFGKLCYDLPEDPVAREAWIDPGWPEERVSAIQEGKVIEGMSPLQVLLAWGTPLHVSRDAKREGLKIWLYNRGGSVREQLLGGGTNVIFAGGKVVEIGGASLPSGSP